MPVGSAEGESAGFGVGDGEVQVAGWAVALGDGLPVGTAGGDGVAVGMSVGAGDAVTSVGGDVGGASLLPAHELVTGFVPDRGAAG